MRRPSGLLRRILLGLGLTLVFLFGAGLGLLWQLESPAGQRLIVSLLNRGLSPRFEGRVVIECVRRIGLNGFDGLALHVEDAEGQCVLSVVGARARIASLRSLICALTGHSGAELEIAEVRVEKAVLPTPIDEQGPMGLERALRLRATPVPSSSDSSRGLPLVIREVEIAELSAELKLRDAAPVHADITLAGGHLALDQEKVSIEVEHLDVSTRGMPHGAEVLGDGRGQLSIPIAPAGTLNARAAWRGSVAGIPHSIEMTIREGEIDLVVDAPHIAPSELRLLWANSTIEGSGAVHGELHGKLPDPAISARVTLEQSSLETHGRVHLTGDRGIDLHVAAQAIDLRRVSSGAPASNLQLEGDVLLRTNAEGAIFGEADLCLSGTSRVASFELPRAELRMNLVRNARKGLAIDGSLTADLPGVPTILNGRLTSEDAAVFISFEGRARAPRLEQIPALAKSSRGRVNLATHGTIDTTRNRVEAKLKLQGEGLGKDGAFIDRLGIDASVTGSVESPKVDAELRAPTVALGKTRLIDTRLQVRGPTHKMRLEAGSAIQNGPTFTAKATMETAPDPLLRDLTISVERGDAGALLTADSVRLRSGRIDIERAEISGLGGPVQADMEIDLQRDLLHLRTKSAGIELARLGCLTDPGGLNGRLAWDVDLALTSSSGDGYATLDLRELSVGPLHEASTYVLANLHDRQITVEAQGALGSAGWFHLRTPSLTVGGTGPILTSLAQVHGNLDWASEIDLEKIDPPLLRFLTHGLAGPNGYYGTASGKVTLYGEATRTSAKGAMPSFGLSANLTHGSLVRPSVGDGPPLFKAEDVNLGLVAQIDAGSGATAVAARLDDAVGELAELDARSAFVPYEWLLSSPDQAWDLLRRVPWQANLTLPRRSIASLPIAALLKGYRGEVEITGQMTGTLQDPRVLASAKITKGRVSGIGLGSPFDANLRASYDGTRVDADLGVRVRDRDVLSAQAQIDAAVASFLGGPEGKTARPWEGSAKVRLAALPTEIVRSLEERQVHALLSGEFVLEGLHREARASVDLAATDVRIRDTPYGAATLHVALDGSDLDGVFHYEQKGAFAQARLTAGALWGSAIAPTLDSNRPLTATLLANDFPLGTLLPFADETLSDLDGSLFANTQVELDPKRQTANAQGTAFIEKGAFALTGAGLGLHDLSAKVVATPDGLFRVQDLTARSVNGLFHGSAAARIDAFGLAEGSAQLRIPASAPFPLIFEGTGYGAIDGDVDLSVQRSADKKELDLRVDLPVLHVQVPVLGARSLQELGSLQNIQLGTRSRDHGFVPLKSTVPVAGGLPDPVDTRKIRVAVNLGKDVEVRCGTLFKTALDGSTTLNLGRTLDVSGNVRLLSGTINVQGKDFEIEEGTVSFVGDDPSNPQVMLSAGWTAPDGTRVHAHFVGRLRTGQVTLSSDPELPRNDILALLLFGISDGPVTSSAGAATPNASGALGFAGTAAAQPLNRALSDFGLGGVSARVDSSSVSPRPEVEVRIARDIALQVAWVLGAPAPGSNPDRTLFTLDWRFVKRWSLKTTIGDAGTSIFDLVWQYRY